MSLSCCHWSLCFYCHFFFRRSIATEQLFGTGGAITVASGVLLAFQSAVTAVPALLFLVANLTIFIVFFYMFNRNVSSAIIASLFAAGIFTLLSSVRHSIRNSSDHHCFALSVVLLSRPSCCALEFQPS
jgi:hypothetical protein